MPAEFTETALRKGEKMFRTVVKIDGMMCGLFAGILHKD